MSRPFQQCRSLAVATVLLLPLVLLVAPESALPDGDTVGEARETLAPRVNGHRPLRSNPQSDEPPVVTPQQFHGYSDAPPFTVVPRQEQVSFFPCEDCHGLMPPNPQRRQLYSPHPAALDHGSGRIWCLDCHAAEDRNTLQTLAGEGVSFDEAYLVCGQCHYQPQKDWYYGAHGKRVANWQGERQIYNCTHCHNPHAPAVRPRTPEPPPPLRRGLEPMHRAAHGDPQGAVGGTNVAGEEVIDGER